MAERTSTGGPAVPVGADEVRAFRLHAHHLTERRPLAELPEVAGACGTQNSPPGSALLAWHARVADVTQEHVDHLVEQDRSLLQTWSVRGAPFYFPTGDAPVFTAGALPATERGRLQLIIGAERALRDLGMGLDETVDRIAGHIGPVLSGRRLAIGELGAELAERVAHDLPPTPRATWRAIGPHGTNLPLGEAVVHFCIRILTLRGIVCLAPRSGGKAPFALVEDWLGAPLPEVAPDRARAALLRRYLHCYGPSTSRDFAGWLGVRTGDVEPWWRLLDDELAPVEFGGRQAWALAGDLDVLRSPPEPRGVRLLPPRDPYTQLRDRDTILDQRHHRRVWKAVGEPGTVLADGRIAGLWRPKKSGRTLALTVTPFGPLPAEHRAALQGEAEQVAALRGASSVRLAFEDPTG
ncbi:AlkZ family DNA glycosylase [Saccharopolyspora sp. HNM0983]|uniref:AlkZ family DNA glycosylase n=1 Tax=Saccharopolyspora montiporae TaxID=2781240 RepID=A0A929B8W4_9PSEU|nr:winged helix DNA-binding domain-containing protein [Saccharopolyspora sp. HNM0983]MBE9375407.1 AlkZ family DNA glycosylase [Saccharopolyspora sp. HNM0983]